LEGFFFVGLEFERFTFAKQALYTRATPLALEFLLMMLGFTTHLHARICVPPVLHFLWGFLGLIYPGFL
jgi:hypothetical protein